MSIFAFTPGPWHPRIERSECKGVNITFGIDSETSISLCGGQSQEHMAADSSSAILEDECRANARLIAAAPEMYEALDYIKRRLQADIDDGSRPDQWSMEDLIRKARAAIAKATQS